MGRENLLTASYPVRQETFATLTNPGETAFPAGDLPPVESPHRGGLPLMAVHHLRAAIGIHNFGYLSYPTCSDSL
jgi:hypothetical protein